MSIEEQIKKIKEKLIHGVRTYKGFEKVVSVPEDTKVFLTIKLQEEIDEGEKTENFIVTFKTEEKKITKSQTLLLNLNDDQLPMFPELEEQIEE